MTLFDILSNNNIPNCYIIFVTIFAGGIIGWSFLSGCIGQSTTMVATPSTPMTFSFTLDQLREIEDQAEQQVLQNIEQSELNTSDILTPDILPTAEEILQSNSDLSLIEPFTLSSVPLSLFFILPWWIEKFLFFIHITIRVPCIFRENIGISRIDKLFYYDKYFFKTILMISLSLLYYYWNNINSLITKNKKHKIKKWYNKIRLKFRWYN